MQGAYGGLVVIISYTSGIAVPLLEYNILTDDNNDILTDSSDTILGDL